MISPTIQQNFQNANQTGMTQGFASNVIPIHEYKLIIPYKSSLLRKSNSTSTINPLAYDDFDRNYNTTKYFNLKSNKRHFKNKSLDDKKNNYTIQFKSDIKLIKRKNISNSDILTKKLRNIYKSHHIKKFYKIL